MSGPGALGPKFGGTQGLLQRLTKRAESAPPRKAPPQPTPALAHAARSGLSTFTAAPGAAPVVLNPPALPLLSQGTTARANLLAQAPITSPGQLPPASETAEAQAAAQQAVEVSPADTLAERDRIAAEAQTFADEVRTDAATRAQQMEAQQASGEENPSALVTETGDGTYYREREVNDEGEVIRETEVFISNDEPPETHIKEARENEDGTWTYSERAADGTGSDLEASRHESTYDQYPLGDGRMEQPIYLGGSGAGAARQLSNTGLEYDIEGTRVDRLEQGSRMEQDGTVTHVYARTVISEQSPSEANKEGLNEDLGPVFDENGGPVVTAEVTTWDSRTTEENPTVETRTMVQGDTRVTRSEPEEGAATWLVEVQSADGLAKDSQLLVEGSSQSIITHTEVHGSQVTSREQLWDTHGRTIDDTGHFQNNPELLGETNTVINYGPDGGMSGMYRATVDVKTGQTQVESVTRRVEGERIIYESHQELRDAGNPGTVLSSVDVTQEARLDANGQEQIVRTTMRSGEETLSVWTDETGSHFEHTGPNGTLTGEAWAEDGKVHVRIGEHTLVMGPDGTFENGGLEELSGEELSTLPLLFGGGRGIESLVSSIGGDPTQAMGKVTEQVAKAPGRTSSGFAVTAQLYGLLTGGTSTLDAFQQGRYFQGVTGAARFAVDAAELYGGLTGTLDATTKWGRVLGVAGAGLDVVTGVYTMWNAENGHQTVGGAIDILKGGAGIGLLLATGTPAMPVAVAVSLALTLADWGVDYSENHSTPPLSLPLPQ